MRQKYWATTSAVNRRQKRISSMAVKGEKVHANIGNEYSGVPEYEQIRKAYIKSPLDHSRGLRNYGFMALD